MSTWCEFSRALAYALAGLAGLVLGAVLITVLVTTGRRLGRLPDCRAVRIVATAGAFAELLVLVVCWQVDWRAGALVGAAMVMVLSMVTAEYATEHQLEQTRRHHLTRLATGGAA